MPHEIERKFLVIGNFLPDAGRPVRIIQGYLSSVPERTVRIRCKGDQAFITVKGAGNASGMSRYEWEKEIPVHEAEELLTLCEPGIIKKLRYPVRMGADLFEVDVFEDENEGLILAEIELQDESESFEKPDWLGGEVSGDQRYYNAYLIKHPYKSWLIFPANDSCK